MRHILSVAALGIVFLAASAFADVRLPSIISEHMVLQSGKNVPIWGWAAPGENVTITFTGQTHSVKAAADGAWRIDLAPLQTSSAPQTLTVRAANTLEITDVLVGEVWLGSGQSNMAMQMKGLHGEVFDADAEIAAADHPRLRMFVHDDEHVYSIYETAVPPDAPDADRPGRWIICAPATAAKFSAIGYYFGREIMCETGAPFGFVNTAVGGTSICAWTCLSAQKKIPGLKPAFAWNAAQLKPGYDPDADEKRAAEAKRDWLRARKIALDAGKPAPKAPPPFKNLAVIYKNGGLFNGMIAPVIPYAIRGVLWYQGERDALHQTAHYYGLQMETLINDWRAQWRDDMYFYWVMIPEVRAPQKQPSEHKGWGVLLRERQMQALRLPKTGIAVTLGLGDEKNGHPQNKSACAHRLALLALHDIHAKPVRHWMAPVFESAKFEGVRVVLKLKHAEGLKSADGGMLKGFAIAGAGKNFIWADAYIEDGKVVVRSPEIEKPAAVRYAWATNPIGNLANGAGMLAAPFRTDDWE